MDTVYDEVKKYGQILERYHKDMVEMEFTMEDTRCYINSARVGKRTPEADLKIKMDLFLENILTLEELLEKIDPQNISKILLNNTIHNLDNLLPIAKGLPANTIHGTGKAVFSVEEAMECIYYGQDFIYCVLEASPFDIDIISASKGIISARGGVTSHAASLCYHIGKPCISGIGDLNTIEEALTNHKEKFITINGETGEILLGLGKISEVNIIENPELHLLNKLVTICIEKNLFSEKSVFHLWGIWDAVVYKIRYDIRSTQKRYVPYEGKYISFYQPTSFELKNMLQKMIYNAKDNSQCFVIGLMEALKRQLSSQVMVSKHYLYFRPLLNPMETIIEEKFYYLQTVGVEFFNMNKFLENYIDIYSIKIIFTVKIHPFDYKHPDNSRFLNYLDHTNPNGESLILNNRDIEGFHIYINDNYVDERDIPSVYHLIRKREFGWSWYADNFVTYREVKDYLKYMYHKSCDRDRLYYLCFERGLIDQNGITQSGRSLIEEL